MTDDPADFLWQILGTESGNFGILNSVDTILNSFFRPAPFALSAWFSGRQTRFGGLAGGALSDPFRVVDGAVVFPGQPCRGRVNPGLYYICPFRAELVRMQGGRSRSV